MEILNQRLNVTSTLTYYIIDSVKDDDVGVVGIVEKKPLKGNRIFLLHQVFCNLIKVIPHAAKLLT